MELSCNLHLDGEIHGTIRADHAVRVGRDGQIKGELKADGLVVAGKVDGTVNAKVVEIVEGGLIEGTVYCDELIIAKGGRFFGESKPMKNNITPLKSESKAGSDDADNLSAQG
ncbi:bactofilin family protein [Gallaecimonas pentaromativorans]|uniref:bactofilin family protein n=1 Tax=Gallaecimonas pentaromativorans TaxID=584787 RepID=UPI001FD5F50E|nr:polymer-forming cytoskeletal protein [Gallaecimonas pentaromativorans]